MEAIGWFCGLFSHSSMAVLEATHISISIPVITSNSPQNLMDLQRLKACMFLNQSFSAENSIARPINTAKPPKPAITTSQKSDLVPVLIYSIDGIIVVFTGGVLLLDTDGIKKSGY
jgi:hypothetical protein